MKAVVYPLGCLTLSLIGWKTIFPALCCKCNISEKSLFGLLTIVMYVMQWVVSNPHSSEILPLTPSMDVFLFVAAGYYLRTASKETHFLHVFYNIISALSILDIVTYRKGGDMVICYLFLTESPDLIIMTLTKMTCWAPLLAIMDTLLHIVFRVGLFGHLLLSLLAKSNLSEDIKMNVFIIHLFSYTDIPDIIGDAVWSIIGRKVITFKRSNLYRSCYTMKKGVGRPNCKRMR